MVEAAAHLGRGEQDERALIVMGGPRSAHATCIAHSGSCVYPTSEMHRIIMHGGRLAYLPRMLLLVAPGDWTMRPIKDVQGTAKAATAHGDAVQIPRGDSGA